MPPATGPRSRVNTIDSPRHGFNMFFAGLVIEVLDPPL